MSQEVYINCVAKVKETGQKDMAEEVYMNLDTIKRREDLKKTDAGIRKKNIQTQTPKGGHRARGKRCKRLKTGCVLVLCVLQLTAITVLWIKYSNLNTEKDRLQTSNNNLTVEKHQLQTDNNNLTVERARLQTDNNYLTVETHQLQSNNNNLINERDQLQLQIEQLYACCYREKVMPLLSLESDELMQVPHQLEKSGDLTVHPRDSSSTKWSKNTQQVFKIAPHSAFSIYPSVNISQGWRFFGSNLYYMSNKRKSWTESRQDCREIGADLVIINSREKQHFINTNFNTTAWIGLSYNNQERTWKWVDNTTLTTAYWLNEEHTQNCTITTSITGPDIFAWTGYPCNATVFSICEKIIN